MTQIDKDIPDRTDTRTADTKPDIQVLLGVEELSILSVEPDSGPLEGGTVCLIKGGGFGTDVSAYFGGQMAQVLDVSSSGLNRFYFNTNND